MKKPVRGDKVAILSPSFCAPAVWPHVYQLGLSRIRDIFGFVPVEFPSTTNPDASEDDKIKDLISAFEDSSIKAVIATLGGDHQVTYVKRLPDAPFANNPKPFLGYSDNTHFMQHLFRLGLPSYYGGSLFVEFAEQGEIHPFTLGYLREALNNDSELELKESHEFSEIGLDWNDENNLKKRREYLPNMGWQIDGEVNGTGILWGGCLESVDEILRHNLRLPDTGDFGRIVLFFETSEEIPESAYVFRFFRALGERGILKRVQGILMGRAKAWEFGKELNRVQRDMYRKAQWEAVVKCVRHYNLEVPIVQNMDFGHTSPQICLPMGGMVSINPGERKIKVQF